MRTAATQKHDIGKNIQSSKRTKRSKVNSEEPKKRIRISVFGVHHAEEKTLVVVGCDEAWTRSAAGEDPNERETKA